MRSEALQQVAQGQEGLIDHVDVVDDGACTREDAGDGVEHLAHIQEVVVQVAGTAVQIDHFLFVDDGMTLSILTVAGALLTTLAVAAFM